VEYLFYIIVFSLVSGWLYLLRSNVLFFLRKEVDVTDLIFSTRDKSFENVHRKFELLEKIKNKDLSYYKKQVDFYHKNAKRTRRKYHHFSHLIEPSILNVYVSGFIDLSKSKKSKMMYEKLDRPFQLFFSFLSYVIFIGFLLEIIFSFILGFTTLGIVSLILMPLIFAICLLVIFINIFLLDVIVQILLSIKKKDNGAVNRNFLIFTRMLTGFTSRGPNTAYVIGGAGVAISSFSSGGGSFGGFGGGSFGGGGAGGSW
tara:strand:+ start:284 stop:1057 length:774 start_codon:yes stop_codon:yes gene_type:complete